MDLWTGNLYGFIESYKTGTVSVEIYENCIPMHMELHVSVYIL